jgi:hypothetical protein
LHGCVTNFSLPFFSPNNAKTGCETGNGGVRASKNSGAGCRRKTAIRITPREVSDRESPRVASGNLDFFLTTGRMESSEA